MKTKDGLYALLLLPVTIAFSIFLDARFEDIRRRAADMAFIAPRLWLQLFLRAIFVIAMVSLLWFVVMRSKPGGMVHAIYLVIGLLLSAYVPMYLNGFDLALGFMSQGARALLLSLGLNSFFVLSSLFIAAVGGLGLARLRRYSRL
jgi:hypothetical protein